MKKLLMTIPFLVLGIVLCLLLMSLGPLEREVIRPPQIPNVQNKLEIHFVGMNRNDAILIRTNEHVIVIDGGAYQEADIIIDYLKDHGIRNIDYLIGSHLHFNHIQSHAKILQSFNVDNLVYNQDPGTCIELNMCTQNDIKFILDKIHEQNRQITIWQYGEIIEIGKIKIEVIAPIETKTLADTLYPQNFNSLNFILNFGEHRFFFSGDGIQEENILREFADEDLKVDLFHFPHHGEDILSEVFINKIKPRFVIETSRINYLDNDNQITGDILRRIGAEIFHFGSERAIIFYSDGIDLTYERK